MVTLFSDWIGAIPVRKYKDVRDGVIRATGISRQSFHNWTTGLYEPSEHSNIRIAYYAQKFDLPPYMPNSIKVDYELETGKDGNKYIHARVNNNNLSKKEDRYVFYLK